LSKKKSSIKEDQANERLDAEKGSKMNSITIFKILTVSGLMKYFLLFSVFIKRVYDNYLK